MCNSDNPRPSFLTEKIKDLQQRIETNDPQISNAMKTTIIAFEYAREAQVTALSAEDLAYIQSLKNAYNTIEGIQNT